MRKILAKTQKKPQEVSNTIESARKILDKERKLKQVQELPTVFGGRRAAL